jgi:DNA/RNA endonuclease G (NUC1)
MSLLNIAIATGIGATTLGYGSFAIKDATSSYNKGNWDWQYKGKLFEDRVGNFSAFSDNKSRYNDYLRGYGNAPKVGYSFDLTGLDVHVETNKRIVEQSYIGNDSYNYKNNSNLSLIGNPTGANTSDSNNYILENKVEGRSQFVTSYNNEKGRPNWVAFKLTKNNLGNVSRQNDFRNDTNLPSNFKKVDFTGFKGFDRGHLANSAAFTSTVGINSSTYVMTNMLAQAHEVNAGPWADLEHYLNNKVHEGKGPFGIPLFGYTEREIQIITGGAGKGGIGKNGYVESINGVEVPKVLWKVAVVLEPGQTTITKDTKTIAVIMPNSQNVKDNWKDYKLADGRQIRELTGMKRLFPHLDPEVEEQILQNVYDAPKDGKGLLHVNLDDINSSFESKAVINARAKGIHNPLLAPLYDTDKEYRGLVISNKKTHSQQFELARYNASMRASGRFTSVVDAEDMGTYEGILRASKTNNNLSRDEVAVAKAFDFAVNSPSLMSRINEFFFIPNGMGRVLQEERGPIPSLFSAVGALIDQSYLTNNPVLRSYKDDGENYFTTKTSFFQDLLANSAATVLATASSIGVYLAVGEPLKAMASRALLNSQEALIKAADTNKAAKWALGGTDNDNIGFKMSVIERQVKGATTAYYSLDNPTFSLYYLDNYQRQRGGFFFSATAREFLISKINPYTLGSNKSKALISATNDYLEVLQSPADIKIIDRAGEVITSGAKSIDWNTVNITTASGKTFNIPRAIDILRGNDATIKPTSDVVKEINDAVNKQYELKITNVSIERNMMLAKKIQGVINLVPMPWAWGIFAGRKDNVTAPMIGNLLDIEGFARYVNASLNNQGFWGAANEFMLFSENGTKASYPAFRIMNHIATMTRSILSFNTRGGQSKRDLEDISKISKTYSQAEINLEDNVKVRTNNSIDSAKNRSARGFDVFNTNALDAVSVEELLDNEATYQAKWKALSSKRVGLRTITLDDALYTYANKTHSSGGVGFLLNHLDKGNSYVGMKISSTKLAAAKWIIGALFIPQLVLTEFAQSTGASLLTSTLAQIQLNRGTTNTSIELQSTNFFSAAELVKMAGANDHVANFVLGTQSLVTMAGIVRWAYDHASTSTPEIHGKMFTGQALLDNIAEVNGQAVQSATMAELTTLSAGKNAVTVKLISGKELSFNVVRENGNITGLSALNAKVAKNWTSFSISLGLTLAAMQTARYVISSTINNERNLMGSAVLSTAFLAAPAIAFGVTTTIDNMAHSLHMVSGSKLGYSNYKVTSMLGNTLLKGLQGAANLFGRNPITTTAISLIGLGIAYWNRLSPFQGDINGPKLDETNQTAIARLGSYVEHVNKRIDQARTSDGGSASISDSISPLEVNAALLAVALGKIINPITSSQKGSTAYVTATQSPLPIFQYYSVIKKVVDSNGSSYTTVNLGLQGPPAVGVAPINVSFPIAFAMNAKSADNVTIKTGYLGTGLILNEGNKDSLSLQDYYNIYSQVALWSGVGIGVSNTLVRNRIWGRNHQILKSTGTVVATESLITQSTRAARDKFLGIATLPFYIAAQSLNLTTGDFRMPGLRLRSTSFVPVVFSAFMGGAIGNHLYSVINTLSQPFTNKKEDKDGNFALRGASIMAGAALIGGISYAKGTIAASRRLAMLESELNITSARFDKTKIDPLVAWMYSNNSLKGLYRNTLGKFGGFVKQSAVFQTGTLENKVGKGLGLLAVGALWNHFITDPTSGKVNPEIAFGDLTKQTEDKYDNTRRMTTVAFGATLFALTAGVTSFNPKSLIFADINPEQIVERFRNRLTVVERLQQVPIGKKNIGFIQSLSLKYETYKLNMEAREVQIIIEEGMGNSPIIQAVEDAQGKIFKNAFNVSDPYSNIKQITSNRSNNVYKGLQSLDISAGTDLNSIIKNNQASAVLAELDKFSNPANNQPASAVLKGMSINRSASNRVHIERWARLGGTTALLGLTFHGLNWASQGMGYKDFQDALIGADEDSNTPWANFRKGVVDFVKLQTKYDRAHSYDIAKGLVGPNLHNSKGEFLINPDSTTKGAINNSLKQLSNLIIVNSPNTFIGVAVGGITIRPDDSDVRLRDYFQIQSASQDFSSAMYSMSSVFGLQELAKKGFLAQNIIANLRGIDDAAGHNQAQLRQFASNIITAVYSQPTRSGKDRIKFTSPNKYTLEAMTTNKALAMSLNQRYKRLQALSYGTNVNIALYTLMNNMNIASPDMQGKFYKALKDISSNGSQTGLGEINQNFFMGGEITVKQIGGLASNSNPFIAAKMSIQDSDNENAFMEMQGIAIQSTANQYDSNKSFFERAGEFLTKVRDTSSLQGLTQALPPFMWLPIMAVGIGSLGLVTAAISVVAATKASQGQVTKDNTLLWEQQHKYFDEGKWFSKHLYEAEELKAAAGKFLLLRRTQVVFAIAEGLTDHQAKKYTSQINELSGALSMKFDSAYRDYSKNYGQAHTQQITRLNDFYDELETRSAPSQTTRLSTRDDRIARTHAREFKSVMFSETLDETITYNHTTHKITEHLLDDYTNKQVLDAYLEGQYDAYNAESKTPIAKADFVDKYYKGFTYDDLLEAKADKFISKAAGKFGGGFNIFGKDRSPNMRHSIDLMTEVYAAKFDIVIDSYYDVIDERIKAAFIQDADNIYTNSVRRELNSTAIIDEDYVNKVSVDQRFNNKLHLREQIKDRLTTIISTKRTGLTAVFDRLLNIVSGGTNRDLITRMTLEATDASKEVLDNVRKYGGGMFNVPTKELQEEVAKAIELDIKQNTRSGLQGSMPVGVPPKALQTTAGLTFLEGLSRMGTVLMNGYQMAMFVSTNLLTFRAAASVASSKTGEREKEMAREEMAKESFDNIWGALFFGTLLMNQSIQKSIIPGIGGLAAGFFGYDLLFKNNGTGGRITAGAVGITLAASSIALFKASKTWGVSIGLAGLTLAGRSVFDLAGSSLSSLSPELGGYITSKMDDFYQGGRQVIRNIQNQSGVINIVGGLALGIGGTLNYLKTGNLINAGVAAIGALIFGVGLGHSLDSKNNRLEGASLQALDSLSSTLVTPFIANKIGQTIVAKTITSKITEQVAKVGLIQSASTAIRNAAIQKTAQGMAIKGLVTGAKFAGAGLKAISGVAAGPWGLVASLVLTAVQIVWILNSPETADDFASNLSNLPTQMFGAPGSYLFKPANQIYNDTKYRDKDYRNPLFQGTVNDAMKQEWMAQIDTLDDPTGRKTAGRFVTSFDAPMTGYAATAEGYGPGSVDPSQDFAFAIRGKAYNQLVTGKQFWNTRMDDKLNHALVSKYMSVTERLQIQAWEGQINRVVELENRKITSAPIIGSTEINAITREAIVKLGEVSTKMGQMANDVNEINTKKNLALNVVGSHIVPNPHIQLINDGTPNIQAATKVTKGKTDKGQTTLEFTQTSSRDSEQIALQQFNIKRGTKVIDGIINT